MTTEVMATPIEILLVEDSLGDARLTQEALKNARVINRMNHVTNGVKALAYLRREAAYEAMPRPDLILLDLNMPRMDGRELLAIVKDDESLKRIPIIILTTSEAEEDILRSYDLRANAYITKPVGFDQFLAVMRTMEEFWLALVKFPPR